MSIRGTIFYVAPKNVAVPGEVMTATAAMLAGSMTGEASVAGEVMSATAEMVAGSMTGATGSDASISGDVMLATATMIAGDMTGTLSVTLAGELMLATAAMQAGTIYEVPNPDDAIAGVLMTATAAMGAGTLTGTVGDDPTVARRNTVVSATGTTATLDPDASPVNNAYVGQSITIVNGIGSGQTRLITAYTGATRQATISPAWTTIPEPGVNFLITNATVDIPSSENPLLNPPIVKVEIAFGYAPLEEPVWIDVSQWVQEFRVDGGRQHELDRFDAGTADVKLDNVGREFDPTNPNSQFWPNVVPMAPIRITATHGTTRGVFSGFIESWPMDTSIVGDSTVWISCVDAFKYFALAKLRLETSPFVDRSMTTDMALTFLLDRLSWPLTRRAIETGVFTVMIDVSLDSEPLGAMQELATAEQGALFIDRDGNVVVHSHNTLLEAPHITPKANFSDEPRSANELPYIDVVPVYNDQRIWNRVVVSPTGVETIGTIGDSPDASNIESVAEDSDSQVRYFRREAHFSVPLVSLGDARTQADSFLADHKEPHLYFSEMRVEWNGLDTLMDAILDLQLLDRIHVKRRPMGWSAGGALEADCFIEHIQHHWVAGDTAATCTWQTTWQLDSPRSGVVLQSGVPTPSSPLLLVRETLYFDERMAIPAVSIPAFPWAYHFDADFVDTVIPVNGADLLDWRDISGNGRHLRALWSVLGGPRPTWVAGHVNGHAAVHIPLQTYFPFLSPGANIDMPETTVFIVMRVVNSLALTGSGDIWKNSNQNGNHTFVFSHFGGQTRLKMSLPPNVVAPTRKRTISPVSAGSWAIYAMSSTVNPNSAMFLSQNGDGGIFALTDDVTTEVSSTHSGLSSGGDLDFWITKLLVAPSVLTEGERTAVIEALAVNYAIGL